MRHHILGWLLAIVIICYVLANIAHASKLGGEYIVLEPSRTPLLTFQECDRAWKRRGLPRPAYAIVINHTICEPHVPCQIRGQAYERACVVGEARRAD